MKNEKFFEILGDIDDRYIENAHRPDKKISLFVWGGIAAALCVGIIGLSIGFKQNRLPSVEVPTGAVTEAPQNSDLKEIPTSEKYSTLDELIRAVGGKSNADGGIEGVDKGNSYVATATGTEAFTYGDFLYYIEDGKLLLRSMKNNDTPQKLDFADMIFQSGNKLISAYSFPLSDNELYPPMCVSIKIYDLNIPENPELIKEFTQSGNITAAYTDDNSFFILTSDGERDYNVKSHKKSDYVPTLKADGKEIPWEDKDISILGNPSVIKYTAITEIDIASTEIKDKRALYGDIEKVFFGENRIEIVTERHSEILSTVPQIYIFDTAEEITYWGRINLSSIMGIPEKYNGFIGRYPQVLSVTKQGDIYRIVGEFITARGGADWDAELFALTVDIFKGESNFKKIPLKEYNNFSVDDLVWEENRAIASVSTIIQTADDIYKENHFIFAEFDGMEINLFTDELKASNASGIDKMYGLGNPFGILKSFIPLKDGIYLRYTERPDGFDIFDFSDSAEPKYIYHPDKVDDGIRYDFIWKKYSDDIFGVIRIVPDAEGDYREAVFHWDIYRVDVNSAQPIELRKTYNLGKVDGFGADNLNFMTFTYNNEEYFIVKGGKPVKVEK